MPAISLHWLRRNPRQMKKTRDAVQYEEHQAPLPDRDTGGPSEYES